MKRFWTFLKGFAKRYVIVLLSMIVAIAGVVNISPRPFIWWLRTRPPVVDYSTLPEDFEKYEQAVMVEENLEYPSQFSCNEMDLYYPKNQKGAFPLIVWMHGGSFIGGDKSSTNTWATMIATQGYAVASVNYEVAPYNQYPGPIQQLAEAYVYLASNTQRFSMLNMDCVFFGGDSAGAQIASQFVAVQTNIQLAKQMNLHAVVPPKTIAGAILYCGPYNMKELFRSSAWYERFFIHQIGWAYFGQRGWKQSPQTTLASTFDQITKDYPPTFLTDGNYFSFEPHARTLQHALQKEGVYTESLFFSEENGAVLHNYQFDFSTCEAMECYEQTLGFLQTAQEIQKESF